MNDGLVARGPGEEAADLQDRLHRGELDMERLHVAALCGHPASRLLWKQLGGASLGRRRQPETTFLIRHLFAVAPQWGLAAARVALETVLGWTAKRHSAQGWKQAAMTLQALADCGFARAVAAERWQLPAYRRLEEAAYWPLEKSAVWLWQAIIDQSVALALDAVKQSLVALQKAGWPAMDEAEGDLTLAWAICEGLVEAVLGDRPTPWRPALPARRRWRVWMEEGSAHGDLYELEQTTYYHLLDWRNMTVVRTYCGEMSATMEGGLWANHAYSGVKAVTVTPRGQVQVRHYSGKVEVVDPASF